MSTLEELLRYKYGEQQTPQDIIKKLDAQNLANKKTEPETNVIGGLAQAPQAIPRGALNTALLSAIGYAETADYGEDNKLTSDLKNLKAYINGDPSANAEQARITKNSILTKFSPKVGALSKTADFALDRLGFEDRKSIYDPRIIDPKETYRGSLYQTVPEGLGSAAAFIGTTAVNPFLGGALAVGTGIGTQAEMQDEARARGEEISLSQEITSKVLGAGIGLSEILNPLRIVRIFKDLPKSDHGPYVTFLKDAVTSSGVEGGQEMLAGVLQDVTAQGIYDPKLKVGESMGDDATVGAIVGFIVGGGSSAAHHTMQPKQRLGLDISEAPRINYDSQSFETTPIAGAVPENQLNFAGDEKILPSISFPETENADTPTAKPMRFDVEERGEEMYNEQYKRGLNDQSPVADTLDSFSEEYVWNQDEMYKKLRSTRPAVTTLEKAIEELPGFDNPNKKYSMQEMLNLARKHGIEGGGKNTYNQNVLSQIEEFTKTLAETSPNKVANLSEKMTKQELLDLINQNNPRFSETRTTYSGNFTNDFFSRNMPEELAYTYHSPFVPRYNAPRSLQEAAERKMPNLTINSQFAINSRLAGDPEIEGIANKTFEQSGGHGEVGEGFQNFGKAPDEIPKDITLGELDNNIFHNRSHIYDDFFGEGDGSRVLIASETQSPYTFTKDPEKIRGDARLNFPDDENMLGYEISDTAGVLTSVDNVLSIPGAGAQEIIQLKGVLNDYETFVTQGMDGNVQRDFNKFIENLNPIFNPKSSINQFREMSPEAAADFLDTVKPYGTPYLTNMYEDRFSRIPKPKFAELWQKYYDDTYKNTEKLYSQIGINGPFDTTDNAAQDLTLETTRKRILQQFDDYGLKNTENSNNLERELRKELRKATPGSEPVIDDLPMLGQWFNTSTKISIQDAVQNNATDILFPSNGKAVTRQAGTASDLLPDNARDFGDFPPGEDRAFGLFFEDFGDEYQTKQINRGKQYKDLRLKALKQAEQDYGIKLPYEEFTDNAGQEFLRIRMTPQIQEAFTVLRKNMGGAIKKPLMNLKYS